MGTGWRRAFCTTAQRDRETAIPETHHQSKESPSASPSPRSCANMGFLSNPSTPRLRCRTTIAEAVLKSSGSDEECKTNNNTPKSAKSATKSPRTLLGSNPNSPRSPFSILKNSLRLSRNSCGVCLQSVKTGQGMAIYTAECSHSFHFPCIAAHVSKTASLVCPVCCTHWSDVPLLAVHTIQQPQTKPKQDLIQIQTQNPKPEPSPTLNLKQHNNDVMFTGRAYNDDEPLPSPAIVPIPEAEDEEDEDEVEEFQGFFVNPAHSSSDDVKINGGDSIRGVEVSLMPEAAVVSVGRSYEAYAVVLKVKAPKPPPTRNNSAHFLDAAGGRAPIDLVTVLDVSASMSGAKLQMMKRAMRLVISSLGSADRLSIISFSACPKRLMPLKRMTAQGQRAARRIIDRLGCRQGVTTSVAEALRKAAKVLEDRRERNPVATIMLLSDGQDEKVRSDVSNQRRRSAHVSSTRFSHVEIPVHSSGFGAKSSLAGSNREPADDDAFTKCVSGLLSVVVQDLRLELGFASGSDPAEIAAVYSCISKKPSSLGSKSVRLGDLYAEEERELLVELRVPTPVGGTHHVLSVRCGYRDPSTKEMINGREQALLVPRAESVRSLNPKIERLRNLFITTRAIAESRRLVENNDLSRAQQLLASARALVVQSSSVSEYVAGLDCELGEVQWRREYRVKLENNQVVQRRKEVVVMMDENGEPLTPTSAWRAAEQLAKVAIMKKSLNRVSDLHGFENARF